MGFSKHIMAIEALSLDVDPKLLVVLIIVAVVIVLSLYQDATDPYAALPTLNRYPFEPRLFAKLRFAFNSREIFDQAYIVDRKNDNPDQFRAIGWSRGRLCSVIFEIRRGTEGDYHYLITAWKTTKQEEESYAKNI